VKYDSMFTRLLANSTEPESLTACWNWEGRLHGKGYGRLNARRDGRHVTVYAHREMHRVVEGEFIEIHLDDEDPFGPILLIPVAPPHYDETIDHLCWNTQCINPDHFEVVSRSENSARKEAR
jgi:hypothetical protein